MDNPYAPPLADSSPQPPAQASDQVLWRVQGERLLVRPGAVLPEVCLMSGAAGVRGRRTFLPIQTSTLTGLLAPSNRIAIFQSRQTVAKGTCLLIGGPVLGFAAGLASTFLMVGDGSATWASALVSFTLMGLGPVAPIWFFRKLPSIGREEDDGWYPVLRVHPAAIERLRELGQADAAT